MNNAAITRIAMWSGPRNISTALMRSFGNRPDTIVCDEPFYAHYLNETGLDHPGADEVIAHHETDWQKVVDELTGPLPADKSIYYQKHMTHHLLPTIGREWMNHPEMVHVFLIRDPTEMITSLAKVLPRVRLPDTGVPQQVEIFDFVAESSDLTPAVIDAQDVLEDPRRLLTALCDSIGIAFDEHMMHWPAGERETDGVWAKWWYSSVHKSTGFAPYVPKNEPVPADLREIHDECMQLYQRLYDVRLTA